MTSSQICHHITTSECIRFAHFLASVIALACFVILNIKFNLWGGEGGGKSACSALALKILDHNAITLLVIVSSDVDAKHNI